MSFSIVRDLVVTLVVPIDIIPGINDEYCVDLDVSKMEDCWTELVFVV